MPSEEAADLNDLLRSMDLSSMTLAEQRAMMEASAGPLPEGTEAIAVDADGVPCEWITAAGADPATTVVSLRGGGYCLGSLTTNRTFCALLSEHIGGRVLNVGYPAAPEHPYPAALTDALTAYRWAIRRGADTDRLFIAGNSAGGGLALATLLALRDAGDPLPAGIIAISPWTDLAGTGESIRTNAATEVMLDPAGITETAAMYTDSEHLTDPYVSPLYGDLAGLPPLLIHVSDSEVLLDDALRFADKARCAGVDVTLDVAQGVPHVWHLFAGLLPEADEALRQLGAWARSRM